jgi:multidrug efflux pump subunit AcrA (membrane-fusion protein)
MPDLATSLPCRRPDLVIRPLGDQGPFVVKDPGSGAYYYLGPEEHFLLTQLDGQRGPESIRAAFAERFGQALSDEDLQEFLRMAQEQKLLQSDGQAEQESRSRQDDPRDPASLDDRAPFGLRLLCWRKSFFDPDRFFTWLAPQIRWFWTPPFLIFSAGCIALAALLLWTNRQGLLHSVLASLRPETAILAWLMLLLVTLCHEFAHGLTCKHYGGEVHEVGFLLIFFMPCFYCNVSDAWLFKEKSRRLWVTFAGGYFELFLWALAVFAWRITTPDCLVNYLAFIVMTACGVQTLFNFNPLLKLDGYYLLSDWLEVHNLQQRAGRYVKSRLRWLLWGAARPEPDERGRTLLIYGLVSFFYSMGFLGLSLCLMAQAFGARLGVLGLVLVGFLGLMSVRGLFHGFTAGEVRNMILLRHKRTVVWALLLGGGPAALFLIPMEDRASGPFQARPAVRAELRAPVAGFLEDVRCDEGDRVSPGTLLARLEVPDLATRIAQKHSEVREAQARLRLLEIGARYEALTEQRRRVERAETWRDLGRRDLERARKAHAEDLSRLEQQVAASATELEQARRSLERVRKLATQRATSAEEYDEAVTRSRVCQTRYEQAKSQRRALLAKGPLEAESERARRDKELADAQGTLTLMEAGTRTEEVEAERARLARLREEVGYLQRVQQKLTVASPVGGVVVTPRLKEKVGQYLKEGELIAVVEEPATLEAEIALAEQDVSRVRPGQRVELKARALPFETFTAQADRLAPAAGRGDVQSTVTLYCRLDNERAELRPGMTGQARVFTGRQSVGKVLLDRGLRLLRTEFWW